MLPRALLFSSDEQASTILREVLSDLRVEVACCQEIFAAVEELTSRNFQIILVDWTQELEASFLFNMARELKSTRNTYTLVVVDAQIAPTLVINPDGFLEKPFTAEQAKHILMQASPFRHLAGNLEPSQSQFSEHNSSNVTAFAGEEKVGENETWPLLSARKAGQAMERLAVPQLRKSAGIETPHRSRPFMQPETSTAKKTVALGCLLLLLAAVLHGERQLGYLPSGLLAYREFTRMLFQSQSGAPERSRISPSVPGNDTLAQADYGPFRDFAHSNSRMDSADRIMVRPIFGQGFSSLPRAVVSPTDLSDTPASSDLLDTVQPAGADPLIPPSLYWTPQLVSIKGGTVHALFKQKWSAAPIDISEEASRALLVREVLPSYPLEALHAGLQGKVVLQALIGRDGNVQDLKMVQGYFALGNAAIAAVKQWRFRPYRLNGELVEMQTLLTVTFPLKNTEGNHAGSHGNPVNYAAWK